jgi:hypothetical protein
MSPNGGGLSYWRITWSNWKRFWSFDEFKAKFSKAEQHNLDQDGLGYVYKKVEN